MENQEPHQTLFMDVQFTDSFAKSLKRLAWHESKPYKFYAFFRHDIPHFIANVWRFRKTLWKHQWWDYRYTLEVFQTSIKIMEKGMHNGLEVRESRDKKIAQMQRVIELLQNKIDDNYIKQAEKIHGPIILKDWEFEEVEDKPGTMRLVDNTTEDEDLHNKKVYDTAQEIERREWAEIWSICKGQDIEEYRNLIEEDKLKENRDDQLWNKWYNGTGLEHWWD